MPSLKPNCFELESAHGVPETHAWSTTTTTTAAAVDHPTTSVSFPVIDLSGPDPARDLAQACRTWGAFQIMGHDVPTGLMAQFEAQLTRLFSLPMERKLEAAMPEGGGYGYGAIPIEKFFTKQMWSEGLTFAGSPMEHARKLWPEDPTQFCDVIKEYDKVMKALSMRLIHLMLRSLGVDDYNDIECASIDALDSAVRLNSYPVCPDPGRAMGMAAHLDSSLVTILYQNGTSGLQVMKTADRSGPGGWATVPARPGSLIVILGDLFQILTNGQFRSGFHRVVVNRTQRRLSAAYFCGLAGNTKVSPVAKLVRPNQGPVYRAVTWPEYKNIKAKLFNDGLDSLKLY